MRSLPPNPGVYSFLSKTGSVLYVGKANNLKKRILSYKRKSGHDPKTLSFLRQATRLKYVTLESEFQALLIEADLIRIHKPKYNIRLKDDKSPLYIMITNETYPRVLQMRKSDLLHCTMSGDIFGPFASAYQVRYILRSVRLIFPYCNANQKQKDRHEPCFYVQLNLCPGACIGKISVEEYATIIRNIKLFLKGKQNKVKKYLTNEMNKYSHLEQFEKAGKLRDQLQLIEQVFQEKAQAIRDDFLVSKNALAQNELWKVLAPYTIKAKDRLPEIPFHRIETYDISNLGNQDATASMVVFIDAEPMKNEYRRFKIRFSKTQDDVHMIEEVIYRRLKHREWEYPDLMVIDGGRGQVQAAKRSLNYFGLHHKIPLIGLSKRNEEIIVKKYSFHSIVLPKSSPALLLLMKGRDEAHRYARVYHHLLRNKRMSSKYLSTS